MDEKSIFPTWIENSLWLRWLVRIALLIWAGIILSYFFWSQFKFFSERLKPFLTLIGL